MNHDYEVIDWATTRGQSPTGANVGIRFFLWIVEHRALYFM